MTSENKDVFERRFKEVRNVNKTLERGCVRMYDVWEFLMALGVAFMLYLFVMFGLAL